MEFLVCHAIGVSPMPARSKGYLESRAPNSHDACFRAKFVN
jgi:hypothetical protein